MSKFISTLTAIIIVILFIVGFRSMILTDSTVKYAFEGLMTTLPFAEPISEAVCNLLGYEDSMPLISANGFFHDIALVMVMSCIQPTATALLTHLFLKLPSGLSSSYEKESYMDTVSYRLKELAIQVFTAPFSAIFAGHLMDWILEQATESLGSIGSVLIGLLSTLVATGLATIPMIIIGTSISVAFLWRFIVTLFGGVLTSLTTIAFSIAIYYTFINGIPSHISSSIISFVVMLLLLNVVVDCFQRAIAGYSVKRRLR